MAFTRIPAYLRSTLMQILATKFHFLIFFGIFFGIALTLIMGRLDFMIRGFIYFVPGILCALLLLILYRKDKMGPDTLILTTANRKFFWIAFVVLFALSLIALYFSSYRPWYYFLVITALFCVIFLQIFSNTDNPSVILFEISCVLGNLIFGLMLKYPYYFGFTDIIGHLYLSKIMFLSGHLIPADLDISYAWFPLYHIFIAEGTSLLGIDLHYTFIIITSLSFIVMVWVLYLLFNQIIKNQQTSLLTCLIFSTTPIVITYSTYVVTRVMAFIGFIFFLFLAHKQIQTAKWRSFSVLTIVFSVYLILVHQVSIIQIIFLLMLFVAFEVIINDYFVIKTKIITFIIISFSAYWLYTSYTFSSIILQMVELVNTPELNQIRSQVQAGNEYAFLGDNISTAIIIFLAILGIGYLLWAYKSKYPVVIGLFALVMIPFYFPSPITASRLAMITFRVDRFILLISPFFAFIIAIGFFVMLSTLYEHKYSRKIALVFGVLIFSYLCFSAITGSNAADSPDMSSGRNRPYFTEPEMNAFDFIPQFIEYNSTITSDERAGRMFETRFFSETTALGLPSFESSDSIDVTDTIAFNHGFFLLRNQELENNGLTFNSISIDIGKTFEPKQEVFLTFSKMMDTSQKIYDNQKVSILAN